MIENKNEASRNLEKALQALEQAKQRVANEKKKQNEKKRKAENHHKYIMGGIVVKYFPDCYSYDEDELNRILSVALQTMECQQIIMENGEWGTKSKKVFDLDENGERIPVIDKKTGQQKVDKRNRKQWKCHTEDSTDWNSKENAKMWRKDLADTINATNEQLGIAVHWEHRSFAEQGIDKEPTIHISATVNALERKGIQTERGNINREIIKRNMMLEQAKEMLMLAKQEVQSAQYAKIKNAAVSVKNEVLEMIAKVRDRKGRLDLPIVSGKHLRKISDRTALQSADNAEKFITTRKIDSFESLANFTADKEQKYGQLDSVHLSNGQKLNRLKELSKMYALYAPIQDTYKESQSLKGFAKMKYDKEHKDSLSKYPELKERMQSLLQNGEKVTPKQWKAEIQSLQAEYASISKEKSKTATELGTVPKQLVQVAPDFSSRVLLKNQAHSGLCN